MDLIDQIKNLAAKISKSKDSLQTEEATKNAFIMPFIRSIGYDVFSPSEVVPEFTADIGTKKNEKVDYAIKKDDKIILLIECKSCSVALQQEHANQLRRYFSVTEARFALLTNGIHYEFYSDIDEPNKMDSKPFFELDMLHFEDYQIDELKKFTKPVFSTEDILKNASILKYVGAVKKILEEELKSPSEEFAHHFASRVYGGLKTGKVINQFKTIVKAAREQFINGLINDRLKSALVANESEHAAVPPPEETEDQIVTTQDEIDAYNIVKAICREVVDVKRIIMRDKKTVCGILLDDNNRKPLCQFYFNSPQKKLAIFSNKEKTKYDIDNLDDIFEHADKIKATLAEYEGQ